MKYYLIITSVIITSILLFACQKEEGLDFAEKTQTKYDINELKAYLVDGGYSEKDMLVDEEEQVLQISDMRFPFKSIQDGINYIDNNESLRKNRATECSWPPISSQSFSKGRRQSEMYEIDVAFSISGFGNIVDWPQVWIDAVEDAIDHWNGYANRTVRFNLLPMGIDTGGGITIQYRNIGGSNILADADVGMNGNLGQILRINSGYEGWDQSPTFVGGNQLYPNALSHQRKVVTVAHELGHTIGYRHTNQTVGCYIREYRGRRVGWWNSPTNGGLMHTNATVLSNAGDIGSHDIVYKWSPLCNRPRGSTIPCNYIDPPLIEFD